MVAVAVTAVARRPADVVLDFGPSGAVLNVCTRAKLSFIQRVELQERESLPRTYAFRAASSAGVQGPFALSGWRRRRTW